MAKTLREPRVFAFLAIFLLTFILHALSRNATPFDSRWSTYVAMSILREGNTNLDEYAPVLQANDYYMLREIDGHYYNFYPIGVPLLAAPFLAAGAPFFSWIIGQPLHQFMLERNMGRIEVCIASFFVALNAALFCAIGLASGLRLRAAILLACIFAFATPAWSTASRALWQHGPSMLMFTLALWLIQISERNSRLAALSALPLAYACVIRPTNLLALALLGGCVFWRHRKQFPLWIVLTVALLAPFAWYNFSVYGSLLSGYTLDLYDAKRMPFWMGFTGTLFSPSRGLFIWSPILLTAFWGGWLLWRDKRWTALETALAALLAAQWIVISAYPVWWGGHSIGPRYCCEMTPILIYFMIPVLRRYGFAGWIELRLHAVIYAALILALGLSVFTHARGANAGGCVAWNVTPVNIASEISRLWDWSDPQFLRAMPAKPSNR
ncbi:hypothetical protein JXA32_10535 [Candidatus Sumerlaeota bacterium]|nr:hypothetical protein [Candidatus Sumerlaeota bacterium]